MLAAYGVFAAYAFGILMNLSGWPFIAGIASQGHEGSLSYVAGATDGSTTCTVPRLHAADLDGQLGHHARDHHRRRHRRARPGDPGDAAPGGAARDRDRGRQGSMSRIRSSSAAGSPRPSGCWSSPRAGRRASPRPCAAGRTRRRRSRSGCWRACRVTSTRHSRSPRSEASQRLPSSQASPDGEASSVSHTTCGSTDPSSPPVALDHRPAVVVAGLDQVELVEGSGPNSEAHSRSAVVEGEALHVAVPVGPDREPLNGLPGAASPSVVIRRILPASVSLSWASSPSPVSPVEA